MSFEVILQKMAEGMGRTLGIFFFTLIFAMPLGLLIAFGRMSKNVILRNITKFYISILRGTPLMLQLMVVYYGPAYLLQAWSQSDNSFWKNIGNSYELPENWLFYAIIIGFVINYSAYFAEIYRSGIEAIPKGQYEAAEMLGYNKFQTFVKIILPQVFKIILPSVTNEIITLVKDTSLAYTIAYQEMFAIAKQIAARETTLIPFAIAAVFYYVFNLLVSFVMERIEKKMNYYR